MEIGIQQNGTLALIRVKFDYPTDALNRKASASPAPTLIAFTAAKIQNPPSPVYPD